MCATSYYKGNEIRAKFMQGPALCLEGWFYNSGDGVLGLLQHAQSPTFRTKSAVVYTFNSSTWQAGTGGSECEAGLVYTASSGITKTAQ